MQEYQRRCRACGKLWHSLVSRERDIENSAKGNKCDVCGQGCGCNSEARLQAAGNLDRNKSEMSRLRSCPDCGSGAYDEIIVDHSAI